MAEINTANTNQSINQSNIWFDTGSICNEKTISKSNINGLVEDNIITDSAFFLKLIPTDSFTSRNKISYSGFNFLQSSSYIYLVENFL